MDAGREHTATPTTLTPQRDSSAFCNRLSGGSIGKSLSHRLPMLRRHMLRRRVLCCPEEYVPRKEGVVPVKGADAQKYYQQQRRD